MKQRCIALVIGILCCVTVGFAQKVKHPSLLYTSERIESVKQRMQDEPKLAEAWEDIRQVAEKELQGKSLNNTSLN